MLELVIDAVKLFTSKDAREGATAILHALKESPEWQRDLCRLVATISCTDQNLQHILRDVIVGKLTDSGYTLDLRQRFAIVFEELVLNAFEHACPTPKSAIEIETFLSSTLVSVIVHNPHAVPVDLKTWLHDAENRLLSSRRNKRGRGLVVTSRKADRLEQVGRFAIKATLFREPAQFHRIDVDGIAILVLLGGAENPAFEKRLKDHAAEVGDSPIILALRTDLLHDDTRELLRGRGIDISFAQPYPGPFGEMEGSYWPASTIFSALVEAFGEDVFSAESELSKGGATSARKLKIVMHDRIMRDLIAPNMVAASIWEAYNAFLADGWTSSS